MNINMKLVRHLIGALLTIAALYVTGARHYVGELLAFAAVLALAYHFVVPWLVVKVLPAKASANTQFIIKVGVLLVTIYAVVWMLGWFGITGIFVSALAFGLSCALWPVFVWTCDHWGLLQEG
jgi:hypothetical protein